MPLVIVVIAVVALLLMITLWKLNPFIALLITAVGVGFASGMRPTDIVLSIKDGIGGTLNLLALVLPLGTMLGKMMGESGGADRIAHTLINRFGKRNVHWAMMVVAFLVGLPVFFQVGFVLLVPLVFTIAKETGMSLVKIGIPLVAGLSTVHGLVPPHPAPMTAIGLYSADTGRTILYALIVGIPTAIIAGPLYGSWIGKRIHKTVPAEFADMQSHNPNRKTPSFANVMFTILIPVLLMLMGSWADIAYPKDSWTRNYLDFFGDPVTALLIGTIYAFFSLGYFQGFNRDAVLKFTNESFGPIAGILLTIGAGGAFNKVLQNSGVGKYIAEISAHSNMSPVLLAWSVAALIRVATGSATVAMLTAAGIVAPIAHTMTGVNIELLVLATGAGSLILSHVNDSGFWMIKEYFGMTVKETLMTWTAMETILSLVALVLILLLDVVV
ncbi:GntP family permease [Tumebacillus sp. ITR2]|uniref:GntP family permease n=1 Tax=Tumebacillus amylolyticus TaxID=2801339 RepID=A0ABS1J8U3_9BACL|nr:GntP family permease [Tumebacillus amylolyticus]